MSPHPKCPCKGSCMNCMKKYSGIVKNKIGVNKVLNGLKKIGWGSEFVTREQPSEVSPSITSSNCSTSGVSPLLKRRSSVTNLSTCSTSSGSGVASTNSSSVDSLISATSSPINSSPSSIATCTSPTCRSVAHHHEKSLTEESSSM